MIITSVQNSLIKEMTKLHQKKYRDQKGLFLVEGYHLYEEAQKADVIKQVFTTDQKIVGDNVTYVSQTVLEKLSNAKSPQGVVTICTKPMASIIGEKILLLDRIQDPGNLGTLLRSALAFGFDTVVLDNTVDVYNDKVLRSTQGAIFTLNIIHQPILSFMGEHSNVHYYGTAMSGELLDDVTCMTPLGVILGNEGAGVAHDILHQTTANITIPMTVTESLNVGVAGSIIMYVLREL